MAGPQGAAHRNLFLGVSVVLLVLGALAALDVRNFAYTGFLTDGNNKVIMVEPGSPAATAGLQVGDVLTSVGGIAVTDTKGLMNRRRAEVGATWPHVVQRAGQAVTLQITHAALPPKDRYVARAATLLGLCYLGFTLWAYLAVPGTATTLLAVFGLSFALAFLGVPYFESSFVRNVVGVVILVLILMGCAALVHFLAEFPTRRPFLERPSGTKLLYGPAVLLSLIFMGFSILQPDSSSAVNIFFRTVFNLCFGGYFLAAIIMLVRRYGGATPSDRTAHGLGLMLGGVIVGLGPLLVVFAVSLVSPSTFLPKSQYYFLTLGLIPIFLAMAARRSARAGG